MILKAFRNLDMHIVFDFDHTLFDTSRHWSCWLDHLEYVGIDRDEAISVGERLFGEGYTLEGHGRVLGIPSDTLKELISQFTSFTHKEASHLVYDDVLPFLKTHKDAHRFTILTFGHPNYQQFKVKWSGLGAYIHDVRIAGPDRLKSTQLLEMVNRSDEPMMFIDDNPKELSSVRDANIGIPLVRMRREGARHRNDSVDGEVCWQDVKSLNELIF
jgi:FMN phosphatase YigB (HAD superfamily)